VAASPLAGSTVTSYLIERSENQTVWSTITVNSTSNQLTYDDSFLSPETQYYYRVRFTTSALTTSPVSTVQSATTLPATNLTINQVGLLLAYDPGNSNSYIGSGTSILDISPTDVTIPNPPSISLVSTTSTVTVSISATPTNNTSIQSYTIQRSADALNWTTLISTYSASTYFDVGLTPSTTYYYRVKFLQSDGVESNYSSVQSIATQSPAVQGSEVPDFNTATPTKYVSKSGSVNGQFAYTTIQAAVNAAVPGDIIAVAPDTYNETVLVTTSGTQSQPIYIQALNPNNRPIIDGQMILPIGWNESNFQTGSTHMVAIAASHIVWDSIDIINSRIQGMNVGPADNNGYFLQNVNTWFSNVRVYRTRIEKCNNRGFQTINTDGVTLGGCTVRETCRGNDTLWNSTTQNPSGWTAAVQVCGKNVSIIETTVAQALGEGIHAGNHINYGAGAFIQAENMVIRNCRIFEIGRAHV
jgi:hypothetical protein